MKVIRIPQPKDSWEDNPCWDCCFGVDGECNAPQEIIDSDEECGFSWNMPNYVYKRVEDGKGGKMKTEEKKVTMKYIDADCLKVEIEKHIKEVKDAAERFTPNMGFFDAKLSGIYDVMAIIDSLHQEQYEMDLAEQGITYKDKVMPTTDNSGNIDGYCLDGENEFAAVKAAVENGYLKVGDKVIIQIRKAE